MISIQSSLNELDRAHQVRQGLLDCYLREIADSPEARGLRALLKNAASTIEESVEQMRQQHQVTISQFQTEIRMLHKRIDSLEAAASVDDLTRFLTRPEMEARIRTATP